MRNKISRFSLDTTTLPEYNYAIFFRFLWLLYCKLHKYASEKGEIQEKSIKLKRNERKGEIQTRKRRPWKRWVMESMRSALRRDYGLEIAVSLMGKNASDQAWWLWRLYFCWVSGGVHSRLAREEYRVYHRGGSAKRRLKQSVSSDTESAEVES